VRASAAGHDPGNPRPACTLHGGIDPGSSGRCLVGGKLREIRSDPHEDGSPDRETLENAIVNAMSKKGYEYKRRARQGDLQIGYVVVLDGAMSDKEINERYGIQPSLDLQAPDDVRYEKGTLVIDITDRDAGRSVWRGALQGFADARLSKKDRQERLNEMVMFMLARFPARSGRAH
jgi:hypothetical protein